MAEGPWKGRVLSPGQIAQKLQSHGCKKTFDKDLPKLKSSQAWKTPSGNLFWISPEECDDEYIEGVIAKIEEWEKNPQKQP